MCVSTRIGALVPDWMDRELILLDANGGLGLGELDVGALELLLPPVADVGGDRVGDFGDGSPLVEGLGDRNVEVNTGRARSFHVSVMSRPPVLSQSSAEDGVHLHEGGHLCQSE